MRHPNISAFLLLIRTCENENRPDCYRRRYDGSKIGALITDYSRHPNIKVGGSTAAGAYQFTYTTWNYLKVKYPVATASIKGFSPPEQDLMAEVLLKDKNAYEMIVSGKITSALGKLKKTWVGLPLAEGQRRTLAQAKDIINSAGGNFA